MYVCMYICMYVCIMYVCIMYVRIMYVCMYLCVCVYVCMYVCVCVYICMCVCVCVCVYTYIYIVFKTSLNAVRHLNSIATYLPTDLHLDSFVHGLPSLVIQNKINKHVYFGLQ